MHTLRDQHLRVLAGLLKHMLTKRNNQPGLFGQRNELSRREKTAVFIAPAYERLHTHHPTFAGYDLGLIEDFEHARLKRTSHMLFQQVPAAGTVFDIERKEAIAVTSIQLGLVHGRVRMAV